MTKRSSSWYRHIDSVTTLLNLQKSQYGPSYYLNLGFWLDDLGVEQYPKENEAHIRIRLDRLLDQGQADLSRKLLNLDTPISETERKEQLRRLLDTHLRPILERAVSVDTLRDLYANGPLRGAAVRVAAQRIIA